MFSKNLNFKKIVYIIHLKPSNTGKQNLLLEKTGGEKENGRDRRHNQLRDKIKSKEVRN